MCVFVCVCVYTRMFGTFFAEQRDSAELQSAFWVVAAIAATASVAAPAPATAAVIEAQL